MFLEIDILNILEIISIALTIVVGLITQIVSIRKYMNKKEQERFEKEQQSKKELDAKIEQLLVGQKELQESQNKSELSRIKGQILEFSDKLRLKKELSAFGEDIYDININSFNIIFLEYEKYKKLGGNSYIDIEMDFIRKEYDILQHYGN
jgi:ABC-type transport system involved in cytochrome bd biosynthesis fused ATPase/permease subunit